MPYLVAAQRQLTERAHPRLKKGMTASGGHRAQDHRCPLRMCLSGSGGGVTCLADTGLAQDQHRPATRTVSRRLRQGGDLSIAADRRPLRIGREYRREPDFRRTSGGLLDR